MSVAILDTGLSDPALDHAVLATVNLSAEDETTDRSGHGTAVANTIHAVDPLARLVIVKVIGASGVLRDHAHLEAALSWVASNRARFGIAVVCMALGDASQNTIDAQYRDCPVRKLVAALRQARVPTVAPAGTRGRLAPPQGSAWPAILREAVSVGAAEVGADGALRLAQGTRRVHASSGGRCATTVFTVPGPPGGSSGAAAVVSGMLAALRRRRPAASADDLVTALLEKREDVRDRAGLAWPCVRGPLAAVASADQRP